MYTNRLSVLDFDGGFMNLRVAPRLHVRWPSATNPGLTPFPIERPSAPDAFTVSGAVNDFTFSFDDSGLTPTPEFAVSVHDPDAPEAAALLFRSGALPRLPTPPPANPQGFFELILVPTQNTTITELNRQTRARFASDGPIVRGEGTITGVALAANGADPATISLTVMGTYPGPPPPPPPPFAPPPPSPPPVAFRYTGAVTLAAYVESGASYAFDAARIFDASISGGRVVFTPIAAGDPIATITSGFEATFLNWISVPIADLLRTNVERTLADMTDAQVRAVAARKLGIPDQPNGQPGALTPGVTITAQKVVVSLDAVAIDVALGSIGSARPATSGGSGCPMTMMVLAAGLAVGAGAAFRAWRS